MTMGTTRAMRRMMREADETAKPEGQRIAERSLALARANPRHDHIMRLRDRTRKEMEP